MSTRDKILDIALELFNREGVRAVSVRDICKGMNISAGNFSYYFPRKEQLLPELYARMGNEIKTLMANIPAAEPDILSFLRMHEQLFEVQQRYRFFYLNLHDVLHDYPNIREVHLRAETEQSQMAAGMYTFFSNRGILRSDIDPGELQRLVRSGHILSNSWLVDAFIRHGDNIAAQKNYYLRICCGLLEPYLMPPSLKSFRAYFEKLED